MSSNIASKKTIFNTSQNKVNILLNDLRAFVKKNNVCFLAGEQRQIMLKTINRKISDAYLMIADLENDVKAYEFAPHVNVMKHLKKYRTELELLEKELVLPLTRSNSQTAVETPHLKNNSTRSSGVSSSSKHLTNRNRSSFTTQYGTLGAHNYNYTDDAVERAIIISEENEKIATEILNRLSTQKDQLTNARRLCKNKKLQSVFKDDTQVDHPSDRCRIFRKLLCNWPLPLLIVFVEAVIIGYVVYCRFIKQN